MTTPCAEAVKIEMYQVTGLSFFFLGVPVHSFELKTLFCVEQYMHDDTNL